MLTCINSVRDACMHDLPLFQPNGSRRGSSQTTKGDGKGTHADALQVSMASKLKHALWRAVSADDCDGAGHSKVFQHVGSWRHALEVRVRAHNDGDLSWSQRPSRYCQLLGSPCSRVTHFGIQVCLSLALAPNKQSSQLSGC
jgi:hypothetical protein